MLAAPTNVYVRGRKTKIKTALEHLPYHEDNAHAYRYSYGLSIERDVTEVAQSGAVAADRLRPAAEFWTHPRSMWLRH